MSVIIFYQNSASLKNEYLQIRGLGGSVGLDKRGSIASEDILEHYFRVDAIGKEYVLKVGEQNILLPKYFKANINNIDFIFYTTSPTSESLTYTYYDLDSFDIKNKKFITLNLSYNLTMLSIKIYEGIEYYLGSSKVSSICIAENFVAPYHSKITYENEQIKIVDVAGSLKKEGEYAYSLNDISLVFEKELN
ncbi:MAG: hypothetical protein ACOX3T_04565 [Bdellovibrionota bacterium]